MIDMTRIQQDNLDKNNKIAVKTRIPRIPNSWNVKLTNGKAQVTKLDKTQSSFKTLICYMITITIIIFQVGHKQ